jgi:hypothetical protein
VIISKTCFSCQTQINNRGRSGGRSESSESFRPNLKAEASAAQPRPTADRGHEEGGAGPQPRSRPQES